MNDQSGLGDADLSGIQAWLDSDESGPGSGDDHREDTARAELANHPAVFYHGQGVMSEHLADFIDKLAERTMDRVLGIGDENYNDGVQAFERYSMDRTYAEFLDEIADAVAYLAFAAIKGGVALNKMTGSSHA